MKYRRARQPAGCYFFTLITHRRRPILTLPDNVTRLRESFSHVQVSHPFVLDGIVILPEHIHCLMRLPEGDEDFSRRWSLIKRHFSIGCVGVPEADTASRRDKREKGVWQRRFWEHLIRDEEDWRRHMDYIHYNPVKHGHVGAPGEWSHSSFARSVEKGWYSSDWGASEPETIRGLDLE